MRCFGASFFFLLGLTVNIACGYTASILPPDKAPYRVHVLPIQEIGVDVDAGGLVGGAVRSVIARTAGLQLVEAVERTDLHLQVEILEIGAPQDIFVDRALRAPEYTAHVILRGTVRGSSFEGPWTLTARGTQPLVSPPGSIERLEGLIRRAYQGAAERASEQLVLALTLRLRAHQETQASY